MDELLLPLFPLEVVLLPEASLPLHIFEAPYKQMIGECLAAKTAGSRQQEFGVVLAQAGKIHTVGCSARIVNVTRTYADGRMDIFTVGHQRFEVLFTNEEKAYLQGGVEFFQDDAEADTPTDPQAERAIELFRQIMRRLHKSADMPIHFPRPYRHLSYRIAAPLPLRLEFKQQLLPLRNETERLRQVIRASELVLAQLDLVDKCQSKAGGNGNLHSQG
jgi:Lon protease-like protein